VARCAFFKGDEEFNGVWEDVGGERGVLYACSCEVGERVGVVDWVWRGW
jgi:hypothetical protein